MKHMQLLFRAAFSALLAALAVQWCSAPLADEMPPFREVYDLVRSNLAGASEEALNQAAVLGLLQQFPSRLLLLTNAAAADTPGTTSDLPLLSRTNVFDGAYGYLRVGRLEDGLPKGLDEALAGLTSTNQLKGLVLDLRFVGGQDYSVAAQVADRFIGTERLLLRWGSGEARSTAKTNHFAQPLAILVNVQTAGAAEALAAVLRDTEVGLVIGARTAGQAGIFKDFALSGGARLRVATALITAGENMSLPVTGIVPDILVRVGREEEKQYFMDAFKVIGRAGGAAALPGRSATNAAFAPTNRPSRLNEAELVRMKREGLDPDTEDGPRLPRPPVLEKPVVNDPALARALDLLKGLALVRQSRE